MPTQKYKFPVQIPVEWNLQVTQGFREPTTPNANVNKPYSIDKSFHNGVDIICGTPEQTWGSPCVWPFPWEGVVWESLVDSPMGATQHAHAQIDTIDASTGIQYSLIFLHLSAVIKTKVAGDSQNIVYREGDIIGYIGNNGAVSPIVTPQQPFNGSHLHVGLGIKKINEGNYIMIDPLLYFDVNSPFRGPDDPNRDKAVYDWAVAHGATPVATPADSSLQEDIKAEVKVLNSITDPCIQQIFIKMIVAQVKKLLNIK